MSEQMLLASQFNRPTKMVRVMTLSPLARIFHPYADITKFLEDPSLLDKVDVDYEVAIEGAHATRVFKSGEIHLIDETLALAYVGVDNTRFRKEYNATGLVYFDAPEDVIAALDYHIKTKRELPADIMEQVKAILDRCREMSHARVIQHCKDRYNSLVAGRNALREAGKEPPPPSDMELLIAVKLSEEINRVKARRAKLTAAFESAAGTIGDDVNTLL